VPSYGDCIHQSKLKPRVRRDPHTLDGPAAGDDASRAADSGSTAFASASGLHVRRGDAVRPAPEGDSGGRQEQPVGSTRPVDADGSESH